MSLKLKKQAKSLSKKGRKGDKYLLHISQDELMGLMGTGKITRNPKTGLPEAFKLSSALDPVGTFIGKESDRVIDDTFGGAAPFIEAAGGNPFGNISKAEGASSWNPFDSSGASGFDYLGGGAAADDPRYRTAGRTVGSLFAGGAIGSAVGGAGAAAADGTVAADGSTALVNTDLGYSTTSGLAAGSAGGISGVPASGIAVDSSGAAVGSGAGGAASGLDSTVGGTSSDGFTPDSVPPPGGNASVVDSGIDASTGFPISSGGGLPSQLPGLGMDSGVDASSTSFMGSSPYGDVSSSWLDQLGKMGSYLPSLKNTMGVAQLGAGAYGAYNAYQGRQAQKAQQKQQQQYFDQLNNLTSNPGQVTSLPGYQFNLDQGNQALARRMASMGYGTSGNLAMATQQYGQDYASAALGQQEQLLASQYGRASPPTSTMPDPTSLAMKSLSNLGYGAGSF